MKRNMTRDEEHAEQKRSYEAMLLRNAVIRATLNPEELQKLIDPLFAFAELGKFAFLHSLALAPKIPDYLLPEVIFQMANEHANELWLKACSVPSVQMRLSWAARWYEQAMPRIVWDNPAYAEQLMVTPVAAAHLEHIKAPWKAFIVDLPPNLLKSKSPHAGTEVSLEHLLVHTFQDPNNETRWSFIATTREGTELWRHNLLTKHLLDLDPSTFTTVFAENLDAVDNLLFKMIGNLIMGLCLTLSDPTKVREPKHTKRSFSSHSSSKRDHKEPPVTRNYVVGSPVKVRVRDAIEDMIQSARESGKTPRTPCLAHFVAGHWKQQAHGPQAAQRKLVHVEGYWRNVDKDRPIITKNHVVAPPKSSP